LEWRDRFVARTKAPSDLVTEADLASQQQIRQILLSEYPDHDFLGEEQLDGLEAVGRPEPSPPAPRPVDGYRWLVDPLDGTTNYVHGLEHYAVSVALERRGQLLVAAVFDPVRGECFTAAVGEGAFLDGQRLRASRTVELSDALVATGFAGTVPRGSREVSRFVEVLRRCRATRRLGSAALNLGYLAAGRLDAYWATSVKIWDVAAGVLLVREAGGTVTAVDGGELDLATPRLAAASTEALHQQLLEALAAADSSPSI
jgi:myo-inositol-1(or 4)-monophosphatase